MKYKRNGGRKLTSGVKKPFLLLTIPAGLRGSRERFANFGPFREFPGNTGQGIFNLI